MTHLRDLFRRGASALGATLPPELARRHEGRYACPICLRSFDASALVLVNGSRALTIEDAPPRSYPGPSYRIALTCASCNHTAGSEWEAHLSRHGDLVNAFRGNGTITGKLTAGAVRLSAEMEASGKIRAFGATHALIERVFPGGAATGVEVSFSAEYDLRKATLALVKAGFVIGFARFGYGWILDSSVRPFGETLANGLTGDNSAGFPPGIVLSKPDGRTDTRRLLLMTEPFKAFVVVFGVNAVLLPHPSGPDLLAVAADLGTAGDFSIDRGVEIDWPRTLEASLDLGTPFESLIVDALGDS